MAVKRWNPHGDISSLREHMDRIFDDALKSGEGENSMYGGDWAPRVDVYESEKSLVLTAEIPGLREKDIDIRIEGFTLIVRGKREMPEGIREENYFRIERSYGSFCRAFSIPKTVDVEGISAEYEQGLLKVTFPKTESDRPKTIEIKPGTEKA